MFTCSTPNALKSPLHDKFLPNAATYIVHEPSHACIQVHGTNFMSEQNVSVQRPSSAVTKCGDSQAIRIQLHVHTQYVVNVHIRTLLFPYLLIWTPFFSLWLLHICMYSSIFYHLAVTISSSCHSSQLPFNCYYVLLYGLRTETFCSFMKFVLWQAQESSPRSST